MAQKKSTSLRQTLLLLVGLSLVYENFAIIIGGMSFSYAMILLILWVLYILKDLKHTGKALREYTYEVSLLVIFLFLIMIQNYRYASSAVESPVFPGTLFFNTLFLVFLLVDYKYHPKDLYSGFIGYAIGSAIVPILFFAGFGVDYDASGRLVFFGNNSNVFGVRLCFGFAIILQMFIVQDYFRLKAKRFWFILPLLLMTAVIFATGSRTALICLLLILVITVTIYRGKGKTGMVFLGLIALAALFIYLQGTVLYDRLLESIYHGDTSGRTDIWETLLPYCWQHPVFGVGITGYDSLAINATGKITNPHNVFVEIFAYGGLVGVSLYVLFWLRLLFCGISLRKYHIYLPLIMFLPLLVNLFCGHVIETKISYMVYAYILFVYKNRDYQII